jgi:hypothetical protein
MIDIRFMKLNFLNGIARGQPRPCLDLVPRACQAGPNASAGSPEEGCNTGMSGAELAGALGVARSV